MRYIDISDIENIIQTKNPNWVSKAASLLSAAEGLPTIKEKKEYIKKNPIWSELKDILKDLSNDKCWYSDVKELVSDYDVDHFRPKGRIKNENGNIIKHDGYWWLAFDPTNYRLSGIFMNRPRAGGGKHDYFPIKDESFRAKYDNKTLIDYESPLLLDPVKEEDCLIIGYDSFTGKVLPFSADTNSFEYKKVVFSAKVLNLDIDSLIDARKEKYNDFKRKRDIMIDGLGDKLKESLVKEAKNDIKKMLDPKEELSSVVRIFCLLDANIIIRNLPSSP